MTDDLENVDYLPLTEQNHGPTVILLDPEDNNVTTNRTPSFIWQGSDADGGFLYYQFRMIGYNSFDLPCGDSRTAYLYEDEEYVDGLFPEMAYKLVFGLMDQGCK